MFNIENLTESEARLQNTVVLAFVGDAVYTLFVRQMLVASRGGKANELHRAVSKIVNATAQARVYETVYDQLSEVEQGIVKRARNAKNSQVAKHASVTDYRKATGFEALLGYLYLSGQMERLELLLHQSLMICKELAESKELELVKLREDNFSLVAHIVKQVDDATGDEV